VVNVTAPLPPDQANPVANEVAARLNVPVATMLKLLSNRVGPVTKPVQAATAERVASILTRAGVEVDVRPHSWLLSKSFDSFGPSCLRKRHRRYLG
jgi:hypothetical protein